MAEGPDRGERMRAGLAPQPPLTPQPRRCASSAKAAVVKRRAISSRSESGFRRAKPAAREATASRRLGDQEGGPERGQTEGGRARLSGVVPGRDLQGITRPQSEPAAPRSRNRKTRRPPAPAESSRPEPRPLLPEGGIASRQCSCRGKPSAPVTGDRRMPLAKPSAPRVGPIVSSARSSSIISKRSSFAGTWSSG